LRPPLPQTGAPRRPPPAGAASAITAGLVAGALVVRLLLQPLFGSNLAYTAFYPAVILATYLAGRRAGFAATALSALLGYAFFVEPRLELKLTAQAFASLIFFAANASVAVYIIAGLAETLNRISSEQRRSEAAAGQNAELFRELNERVTHHLHLVSGVLALQAQGEPEKRVADALAKASETSLELSRAHRDFAGRGADLVDFTPFARQLVAGKLRSAGLARDAATVAGDELQLPADTATSLGVALLESLTVLLEAGVGGELLLEFASEQGEVSLRIAELSEPGGARLARLAEGYLLRSALEQLGATLSVVVDSAGSALQINFPAYADAADPTVLGADGATLH
jgi:hypothetical protein